MELVFLNTVNPGDIQYVFSVWHHLSVYNRNGSLTGVIYISYKVCIPLGGSANYFPKGIECIWRGYVRVIR